MNEKMHLGKFFELQFLVDLDKHISKQYKPYQIFTPLIDDNGIDLIIRTKNGEYKEIQVKGRKKKRSFLIQRDFKEHNNYWFVFYCKDTDENYTPHILSSKMVKKVLNNGRHVRISPCEKYSNFDDILKPNKKTLL